MKRKRHWLLVTIFLLVMMTPAWAQDLDETKFMSVDQVKEGMKGVGKTVFSGFKIEEFQVEILGIMKNARPRGDLILARVSGGPLAKTGMIQGMSGSPVYIDGKLLGAAAFGWAFSKEPLCGITPVEEMLAMWRQIDAEDRRMNGGSGLFPFREGDDRTNEALLPGEKGKISTASVFPASGLVPIKTPVMVSGFDERVVAQMASVFEKYNMNPVQAGSGAETKKQTPLEPGSSLAVELVSGDVGLSAVGTLTHREGDRVIGFGHPLFTAGGVDFPMSGAEVHSVLPSTAVSFKLASTTGATGVLRQDRRPGVAGLIGQKATTIPVDLTIHGLDRIEPESYHFEIIDHSFFTPNLVNWTTHNAFLTTGKAMGDATTRMKARISIDGYDDLYLENVFAGAAPQAVLAIELGEIAAFLMRTPLEKVRLKGFDVDVAVEPFRHVARITSARINKVTVQPGEEIQVTIFLQPYRGEEQTVRVTLQIPGDAPEGRLGLQITDAASSISWEQRRAPHRFQFQDVEQLLDTLRRLERNDQLIVKLVISRSGAVVKGRELPSLPPSALAVLRGSLQGGGGGITHQEVLVEKRLDTGYVLSGQVALPVEVRR